MLKQDFIDSLKGVIADSEIDSFVSSIDAPLRSFVRRNPFKECSKEFKGEPVAWCSGGEALTERELFTVDPFFHAGAYYVQEASSMFLEQVFSKYVMPNAGAPLKVLDLCAAPGGKSTHLSAMIGLEGLLVANEVIRSRANILKENIIKWGLGNTLVTNNDPSHFAKLPGFFDCVVVDTPCSGEGMFRKNVKARDEWSLANVELCCARSRRILTDVWGALAEGGYLIYSTCTFNTKENEQTVEWLCSELGAELVMPDIAEFSDVVVSTHGYRFHPNRVSSEGYFVAVVRKTEGVARKNKNRVTPLTKAKEFCLDTYINNSVNFTPVVRDNTLWAMRNSWLAELSLLFATLNVQYAETEIGEIYGKKIKPSHALALSVNLNKQKNKLHPLSYELALDYLRRNTITPEGMKEGFCAVAYEGLPLGWLKCIGNRTNNLYPKESRILNY